MSRGTIRGWTLVAAGLAGGFFAVAFAVATLPARIAVASLGGAFMGVALYLHGRFHRLDPPRDRVDGR